jgi:hypothetical protein
MHWPLRPDVGTQFRTHICHGGMVQGAVNLSPRFMGLTIGSILGVALMF